MKKRKLSKAVRLAPQTGTVRLADVLPQLIARYGIQRNRNIEALAVAWSEAVEPPFDAVTRVVGLSRGTLEIMVPHTAFVQELSFRQKELLEKIRASVTDEKIKKIKFVVG